MKCSVKLYSAGKVHYEEMYCNGYEEAKKIAKSRYPTAKIVSVNAVFN